uniref:ORF24 n=1 Tax=Nitrosopumilaceae spindle-shaped virus TaxID=3065433 RepID=A0AAT9JA71_9VIRU
MVENKSYTCDRCGQVFITDDKPSYKIMSLSQLQNFQKMADDSGSNIAVIVFRYTRLGLDLCTDCNKQLTVWLETKPKVLNP